MFKRVLKSICDDINMLYKSKNEPIEFTQCLMQSIDRKMDCVKPYDEWLWTEIALHTDSYRQVRAIIIKYLKEVDL